MPPVRRLITALAGGFAALAVAPVAHAELSYGVNAGVGYSDNIRRVPVNETDETIGTVGASVSWSERRPRLDGEISADLSYYEYLDDTYDSELAGTADAELMFQLIPERLTWWLQDSFGQVNEDPFAPVTPDTRENVNYLTTGPDLLLRLGQTGRLRFFGYYSLTEYETSPLDGERLIGGMVLGRATSEASELGLHAVTERIEYEDLIDQDFDRNSLFASYTRSGGRTDLSVEVGYTWLRPEAAEDSDGGLLRVALTRDLSASSSVSLSFGTQLTDSSEALRSSIDGPGGGGGAFVTASSDPFENRYASLGWSFNRNRTSLSASVDWIEDRYETQTQLDRTSILWNASADRQISPRASIGLLASLTDDDFDTTGESAEELRFGATFTWQFGRRLGLRVLLERYDRESTDLLGEYVENRGYLTLFFGRSPGLPL